MSKIPFLELLPGYEELQPEFDEAYHRVMKSGWYLLGPETEAFEEEFAKFIGVKHCVSVGSGLDALVFALLAMDVGSGDEVLVPAQTFIATFNAVAMAGAKPIPIEVLPGTGGIDPSGIEAAITDRTRAIMPVHLFGIPAAMNEINEIAKRRNLIVIEDAAQAHGATVNGVACGRLASCAAFSFYPGKNLGAFGDGGAFTTDDKHLAQRVKRIRNYGCEKKYHHVELGYNSRLDELQSAFLRVKLGKLDDWNARRESQAKQYYKGLASLDGLSTAIVPVNSTSSFHLFPVFCDKREALQKFLASEQIGTLRHYPITPVAAEAFAHMNYRTTDFPNAMRMADQELSLPLGPHLAAESVDRVCKAIVNFFEAKNSA